MGVKYVGFERIGNIESYESYTKRSKLFFEKTLIASGLF